MSKNGIFCPLVYNGIATDPSGILRPCCVFDQRYGFTGPVTEYKNSKEYKKTESKMRDGFWAPGCVRCQSQESRGAPSKRLREIKNFKNRQPKEFEDIVTNKNWDNAHNLDYDLIDLRLSNTCNLGCLMCNPKSSSFIESEVEKNRELVPKYQRNMYDSVKQRGVDLKHPYSDQDVDDLLACIQPHSRVYFTGGEPSVIKHVLTILEVLIERGLNKTVKIEFNSNFQTKNPRFIDLLSNFSNGYMMPSLDGVGERAEYIRYPSDWENIRKNILLFKEKCPDWDMHITPTISILNVFYLHELKEFADEVGCGISFNNILDGPKFYNIGLLSDEWKQVATNTFEQYGLTDQTKGIVNYMKGGETNYSMLLQGENALLNLDKLRQRDYKQSLPILKEVFDDAYYREQELRPLRLHSKPIPRS